MTPTVSRSADLVARDAEIHTTLSRGESLGLALDVEAGLASTIAAVIIIILIFRRVQIDRQYEAMDIYVISLFTAEVIQGLGHGISLKWVIDGGLNVGTFCTVQGVLRQFGDLSVALCTLAIALQTFATIWWLKEPRKLVAFISVGILWTFCVLLVGIRYGEHTKPPNEYYAHPRPYWCWIGQDYKADWYYGEFAWFLVTLALSTMAYHLLFLLHLRVIKPGRSWYRPKAPVHGGLGEREVQSKLWTVVWYPIAYCIQIFPLSIVRLIEFKQIAAYGKIYIKPGWTFFVVTLLGLSGVIDAILYRWTRTSIFVPRQQGEPEAPDLPANREQECVSPVNSGST